MKRHLLSAAVAAILASCVVPSTILAQAPRGASAPGVAIVDLSYIFKHYHAFQSQTEDLKREVEGSQKQFEAERDELRKMREELKRYTAGTPPYKRLESEVTNREAKLAADVQLKKKEFVEREAKMYFNAYRQITNEVQNYARSRNIALVLRFNGETLESPNPSQVMKQLNKAVVYYSRDIDITPVILHNLNRGMASRPKGPIPGKSR